MGHKRTRNRYPRLPDAVQNLLALHGLKAVAEKRDRWYQGARVGWVFNVVPDKPAPPHPHTGSPEFVTTWVPVFSGKASDSLETWIARVEAWEQHGRKAAFNIDYESIARNNDSRFADHFEYADAPADAASWPIQRSGGLTRR